VTGAIDKTLEVEPDIDAPDLAAVVDRHLSS
jgi:hypothetical protein